MEVYVTLKDLANDLEGFLLRVQSTSERVIIQNDEGETIAALVPSRVIDVIDDLKKHTKITVIKE